MAGLLLGSANVMILDEPGNHLDVETVEALAEALEQYKGTVVFTSHDRHFVRQIATSVIEVRDGTVKTYFGDYNTYLESVEKEVDDGERLRAGLKVTATSNAAAKAPKMKTTDYRETQRENRRIEKEIKNLEKKIQRLDEEKKSINDQLLTETDPKKATELHEEQTRITVELAYAEEKWLELSGSGQD